MSSATAAAVVAELLEGLGVLGPSSQSMPPAKTPLPTAKDFGGPCEQQEQAVAVARHR